MDDGSGALGECPSSLGTPNIPPYLPYIKKHIVAWWYTFRVLSQGIHIFHLNARCRNQKSYRCITSTSCIAAASLLRVLCIYIYKYAYISDIMTITRDGIGLAFSNTLQGVHWIYFIWPHFRDFREKHSDVFWCKRKGTGPHTKKRLWRKIITHPTGIYNHVHYVYICKYICANT